jgi:hypothetical protein
VTAGGSGKKAGAAQPEIMRNPAPSGQSKIGKPALAKGEGPAALALRCACTEPEPTPTC